MFYRQIQKSAPRLTAFFLVLTMLSPLCLPVNTFAAQSIYKQRNIQPASHISSLRASSSVAAPATMSSASAPVPGMEIIDQESAEPLIVSREAGLLSISQSTTSRGYNSARGSQDVASLLLFEEAINQDFTLSATISVTEFKQTGTGCGVYIGAFSGSEARSEFASLGFRGDSRIRGYGYTRNGNFGAAGTAVDLNLSQQYKVTFSRTNGDFFIGLEANGETLIAPARYNFYAEGEMQTGAFLYPGISFIGVAAEISDLLLVSEDVVLLDSSAWEGHYIPDRMAWENVGAPVLGIPIRSSDSTAIEIPFTMSIGNEGADYLTCYIQDEWGTDLDSQTTYQSGTSGTFTFIPGASGTYQFILAAGRNSESEKKFSELQRFENFVIALTAPNVRALTTNNQAIKLIWSPVPEAERYQLFYQRTAGTALQLLDLEPQYADHEYCVIIPDLTVGESYYFEVIAMASGRDNSPAGNCTVLLRESAERDWQFTWFGTSTNDADNWFTGNIYDGLILESANGRGKFTGDGYDGMAFYYTKIRPETENFVLQGTFTVSGLTISNGQEGFALLARDSIGVHGDNSRAYYTNSVAAMATKVDYNNLDNEKVTLRLGIGSRVVKGIQDTFSAPGAGTFSNIMTALDQRIQQAGEGHLIEQGKDYTFILKKTNTGYHMIYENEDGHQTEDIFYHAEELTKIDPEFVYVGFAAARNCQVSVSDIHFSTTDPETDPPAVERPIHLIDPSYQIVSPKTSGQAQYTLAYLGNADGSLTIMDQHGNELVTNDAVIANEKITSEVKLSKGENVFTITFTPNQDYQPGEYQRLSSYESATFTVTVNYHNYGTTGQTIVVAPEGTTQGTGSYANPLDIKTAVNFVQPGQTILMKSGIYNICDDLHIPRGIDGTADNKIYLISDPDSDERAIIDFMGTGTGFEIWGNYWYIRGLDVRNSANMSKGVMLAGSHNILDLVTTYNNGNTGIQVSGLSSETDALWPSENLILNCTSYNNSDAGMEDADGFAAKLTCGYGNVFRGCIAYNNADDGWDLFAKVATGTIGAVTIEDCITYRNGYLLDGTTAGNGNGFKMGGSGLPGSHRLENSISFENKAKGIDSNSCPDIEVFRSTSFNNGSYNVALYSNGGVTTDFIADGILSYKTGEGVGEQLRLHGQPAVLSDTNYFFDGIQSVNSDQQQVSDDWFVSLDSSNLPVRRSDGSIDMQGFLELTDIADPNSGARINTIPSPDLSIPDAIEDTKPRTPFGNTGNRGSGNSVLAGNQLTPITYPASNGDNAVWHQDENGWYMINPDGSYPKSEWKQVTGRWYFFNEQGYMVTGWQRLDQNQWFYMNLDGAMITGWIFDNNEWYYLNANGAMNVKPLIVGEKSYYFTIAGGCINP